MVPGQTTSNQTPQPPAAPPAPASQQPSTTQNQRETAQPVAPGPKPESPKAQSITVVQMIEKPTRETTVGDILLGSVGFVGMALLAAFVVGLLAGSVFIFVKRLRPDNAFNGQTADEAALKLNALSDEAPRVPPVER